ncbi:MAG: hypothetical protein R3270_03695 [Gammaproteobacteria bacterium]|nr:hypothetical protein [Gammaproteobacteria bacterium]
MDPFLHEERAVLARRIRESLLEMVGDHPKGLLMAVAARVNTIYPNVYRVLREMIDEGLIEPMGRTKGRRYFLSTRGEAQLHALRARDRP